MTLLLKLAITPTLIASATLVGRRFGPSVAGWLVGFPFTSAPVSLFLTAEQGPAFAAAAAVGSMTSCIAQASFALAYTAMRHRGWVAATIAGTAAFAAAGVIVRSADPSAIAAAVLAVASLVAALRILPRVPSAGRSVVAAPTWDIPARAAVATALVVGITAAAPLLGPLASGIVSGFPVYAAVLAVFAQRTAGPQEAAGVMRGLVVGLFGFASFFFVVAVGLLPLGALVAYALATVSVFAVQGISLVWLQRTIGPTISA